MKDIYFVKNYNFCILKKIKYDKDFKKNKTKMKIKIMLFKIYLFIMINNN